MSKPHTMQREVLVVEWDTSVTSLAVLRTALPLAIVGVMAALAMSLSSLMVLINTARIRH